MPPITLKDLDAARLSGANFAFEEAARICVTEADACLDDIVPGDKIGGREARARAGGLLTAANDIRARIKACP